MNVRYLILVCASFAMLGAALQSWPADAAGSERQLKKPAKEQKAVRRRLTLLPKLCVEQFVENASALTEEGPMLTAKDVGTGKREPLERLRVTTDWGLDPFVGSTPSVGVLAPERNPEPGGAALPGSDPLCQLDAGVSYDLAPGARLDLGYRLPSSTWSNMFSLFGDETETPTDKKVSVGIRVEF